MAVAGLLAAVVAVPVAMAHDTPKGDAPDDSEEVMQWQKEDRKPAQSMAPRTFEPCANGKAGPFPCENVDLMSFLPLDEIGGGEGNDIWGWTDPQTGEEYALMGLTNGTAFVNISDPKRPVHLGNLPSRTEDSIWRDVKVHDDHAFIVSEAERHGMQVFDLTKLRGLDEGERTFEADANYDEFSSAHNVAINEDSGFAYAVGTDTCAGGLHMVDIQDSQSPEFAGCYDGDGYTHDTQVVNYQGPDEDYQGREIAFSSNEDTLTITDVTDKENPELISRLPYAGAAYTHQGWLSPDQRYFYLGDELDELVLQHNTRTRTFDLADLDDPLNLPKVYDAETEAIDHNMYTKGGLLYQANYRAGFRLLETDPGADPGLREVGFFDIYPQDDEAEFNGAWSNYPYYDSGVVAVSGIEQGLFVLKPKPSVAKPKGNR